MDQLFKALPRDLQWEILSVFVGTHVVRNGKLMRKMTGEIQKELERKMNNNIIDELAYNMGGYFGGIWIKYLPIYFPYGTWVAYDGICFNTKAALKRGFNMDIHLHEDWNNREITYIYYRHNASSDTYKYFLEDEQNLSNFIKHDYPSYPYTDKKMCRPSKKITLYNN
jgi:hypothetical protein